MTSSAISLLQGCSGSTLRALHWTLSTGEDRKRHALLRPLHEGGAACVMTMPKSCSLAEPEEKTGASGDGKITNRLSCERTPLKKKQRLQKSQLRLQNTKALQTPLHWICSHDVLETLGECIGGWPARPSRPTTSASCLARSLLRQWPAALLVPDVLGLWPLSHFEPDFCDSHMQHSPQRELLLTLLQSLAELECRHTELLMMLDGKELLSLLRLLHRVESVTTHVEPNSGEPTAAASNAPEALWRLFRSSLAFAGRAARRMAALEQFEQRKDAQRWQLRGKEVRHRLGALRRSTAAVQPARAARAEGAAAVGFTEALAQWNRRKESYEERLRQLRFELGRIPARQSAVSAAVAEVEMTAPLDADSSESASLTYGLASEAELLIASLRRQRLGDRQHGQELRRALGAAVERLAVDLYEMESHFVYELVQNADDNSYAAAESPWLRLELHRGTAGAGSFFLSVNNEVGLSPQDVRAICDVNASSKKGRQGVTGHKGIGWKSCFQVSDCPYMLSGAFTFKFDVKALGKLGYVTPTWVGEEELHALPPVVWEAYYAGYTVTYLPLRRGTEDSVEAALAHLEEHLPCLLFLRRLKSLELVSGERQIRLSVEDHEDGASVACSPVGAGISGATMHRFLMHRHSVLLDGKELILTLAFPDMSASEKLIPQALYCLLPVRQLGFCFCLDGPFELIASRGDIHEGSRQNQVLCEALPAAFASALATHSSLAPRALSLLGPAGPEPFWQAVQESVMQQLHGMACVPLEEGGLEEPHRCLLRPTGLAGEASRLVPSKLLWSACGKRWAKAGGNMTLEEMSFDHWRQILDHRDTNDWPRGLCGSWLVAEQGQEELPADGDIPANAAENPKEWRSSFQCLFAYLGDLLQTADEAVEVIRQLWDLELLPGEAEEGSNGGVPVRLYRCRDVVFCGQRGGQRGAVALEPPWAWKKLLEQKLLRVLDQSLERELRNGSAASSSAAAVRFVEAVCLPLEPEALFQQISEHFMLDSICHVEHEVLWSMLAVLQHLFLDEQVPSKGWRALGEMLWFPASPHLLRAGSAVCPSFLGCVAVDAQQLRATEAASSGPGASAMATCCVSGLPLGFCFLDTAYLTYSDSLAWEAFFSALGVRMLRLAASAPAAPAALAPKNTGGGVASALPQVQSSSKSAQIWASRKMETMSQSQLCQLLVPVHHKKLVQDEVEVPQEAMAIAGPNVAAALAKDLVCREWWQKRSKRKPIFEYLQSRLPCGASWLRELPVSAKGKVRQLQDHLLEQSDLAQICGPFLPVVRLPEPHPSEVRHLLSTLGLLGDATPSNLLRCLKAVAETCQDVSLFVALYQRLARCGESLEQWQRRELKKRIFVPGHGMLTSGTCAWHDSALMQLAEVPALCAHYERHGPVMEDYFTRLVALDGHHFSVSQLLTALRRMVLRVNEGEAAVPGCSGLENMMEMTAEIYSLLSLYLKDHPSEVSTLRRSFCSERLLLLRLPGSDVPKRLQSEEAFWQLAPELQVESLQLMSLERRYSADLRPFFLAVGVNEEMTRSKLKALLQRPAELVSCNAWSGLNVSDVEDLGLLQTSSNFRPPDWRPDDQEDATTGGQQPEGEGRPGVEPDFRPPRREGGPHVPAMRTAEELERIEREEAQRRAAQRARQQQQQRNCGGLGSGYVGPNGRLSPDLEPQQPSTETQDEGSPGSKEKEEDPGDAETLQELQNRLEELSLQSQRRQQESYDLRRRWAQAEDDAERYMKILEQFYAADASLRAT